MPETPDTLDSRRTSAALRYPALWDRLVSAWAAPGEMDSAWLMYSANYLLKTAGVRWAIDPLTLHQRLPSAPQVDLSALAALDYVVLTHRHADHLDLELLGSLREAPIHWIFPQEMLLQLNSLDLPAKNMTLACPGVPLHLGELTLVPFEGLHWEADASRPEGRRGVPSMGYLAEFNGKRWLFPGDTRDYDSSRMPTLGPVDGLFAHLWLGRSQALKLQLPLLEAFGRFCLDLHPGRIILTHLDEWGRQAEELWTDRHARMAEKWFNSHAPGLPVTVACTGDEIGL